MNPKRKQRLALVGALVTLVAVAVGLMLMALNENINLFFSPTQVAAGEVPDNHVFRLGGLVENGSVKRRQDSLEVEFRVTDTAHNIPVVYTGILPDLFREGQGIIALGRLNGNGMFVADEVLAKHDENYMPPEVAEALQAVETSPGNMPLSHPGQGT